MISPVSILSDSSAHQCEPRYRSRVLLIDDQALIGEAVRRALSGHADLEFHHCADAARALEVAEHFKPTVILQDLVMPGVDGLTLLRQYREDPRTRDVPVVVLSAKEESIVKSEAFALGASDYLIKLPDAIELIARIRHHSKAYINQLERDAAHLALRESERRLKEINVELERLTQIDGLTGLSNRRYFDEYMAAQWKVAVRNQTPLGLLMVDVDNFKLYNDSHGHLAGDQVLKAVAGALMRSFGRPSDLIARFGGEEFVVLLPDTCIEPLASLAERLKRNIAVLQIPHGASSAADHVTVSIGAASTIPEKGASALELIDAADGALYKAKNSGKNRVVITTPKTSELS
jgi:two-component system chemotaxis family response regulator WspR